MRFAHISDMHVGKSWMFDPDLLEMAIDIINDSDASGVLITGDLTDWGLRSEYEMAHRYLRRIKRDIHIIPGNHDARIAGYKIFEELFCKGSKRSFSKAFDEVLLIGLDSSEPDIDDGHIGREQLEWLDGELKANDNEKKAVVTLHHHLVPVPNTGRERNILVDAGDVLEVLNGHKVPLVVTGHKHNPWVWHLGDMDQMIIYSGGTVSCKRTAVSNAFSFIDISKDGLRIDKIDLPSRKKQKMAEYIWR